VVPHLVVARSSWGWVGLKGWVLCPPFIKFFFRKNYFLTNSKIADWVPVHQRGQQWVTDQARKAILTGLSIAGEIAVDQLTEYAGQNLAYKFGGLSPAPPEIDRERGIKRARIYDSERWRGQTDVAGWRRRGNRRRRYRRHGFGVL